MRITPLFWHCIYWGTLAARRLFAVSLASLFALHLGPGSNGLRLDNELSLETSLKLKWVLDKKKRYILPILRFLPWPQIKTQNNFKVKVLKDIYQLIPRQLMHFRSKLFSTSKWLWFEGRLWTCQFAAAVESFPIKVGLRKRKNCDDIPDFVNHISPPLNSDCNDSKGS